MLCKECFKEIDMEDKVCSHCGTNINRKNYPNLKKKEYPNWQNIVYYGLLFRLLGFIGITFYLHKVFGHYGITVTLLMIYTPVALFFEFVSIIMSEDSLGWARLLNTLAILDIINGILILNPVDLVVGIIYFAYSRECIEVLS